MNLRARYTKLGARSRKAKGSKRKEGAADGNIERERERERERGRVSEEG